MMPRYKCHKEVEAWQICFINKIPSDYIMGKATDFVYRIQFDNKTKDFPSSMFSRYLPIEGDYYVVYDGGYESFSPKKAFEEGYSLIGNKQ